jgi:hypothetical protein
MATAAEVLTTRELALAVGIEEWKIVAMLKPARPTHLTSALPSSGRIRP